jgi:hypothetical protein
VSKSAATHLVPLAYLFVIPAFAGMTVQERLRGLQTLPASKEKVAQTQACE